MAIFSISGCCLIHFTVVGVLATYLVIYIIICLSKERNWWFDMIVADPDKEKFCTLGLVLHTCFWLPKSNLCSIIDPESNLYKLNIHLLFLPEQHCCVISLIFVRRNKKGKRVVMPLWMQYNIWWIYLPLIILGRVVFVI